MTVAREIIEEARPDLVDATHWSDNSGSERLVHRTRRRARRGCALVAGLSPAACGFYRRSRRLSRNRRASGDMWRVRHEFEGLHAPKRAAPGPPLLQLTNSLSG